MKAYININQRAFNQLSNAKSIKVDLIDATIFEFVYKFAISNNAIKQLIDNKLHIWCSYQKIIDDNPLLNIKSKKAIEIRLNKLCKLDLLHKFTDKKKGNKTYFNVTDLAYTLVIENTNLSNEDYQPLVNKVTNLSNEDYYNSKLDRELIDSKLDKEKIYKEDADGTGEYFIYIQPKVENQLMDEAKSGKPTCGNPPPISNTIDSNTINNSNKENIKEKPIDVLSESNLADEVKSSLNEFFENRKELAKSNKKLILTSRAIKTIISNIESDSYTDDKHRIESIQNALASGWANIYPSKKEAISKPSIGKNGYNNTYFD